MTHTKTVQGYEIELIDRDEAAQKIGDLDTEEIVRKAYAGHIQGMKAGLAEFDLQTGRLITNSLGTGETNAAIDSQVIVICNIEQNIELLDEDLLTPEELADREDGESVAEYCGRSDIDIGERDIIAMSDYFSEKRNDPGYLIDIDEQFDRQYNYKEAHIMPLPDPELDIGV